VTLSEAGDRFSRHPFSRAVAVQTVAGPHRGCAPTGIFRRISVLLFHPFIFTEKPRHKDACCTSVRRYLQREWPES